MELTHGMRGLFISIYKIYCIYSWELEGTKYIFDRRKILNENIYGRKGHTYIHTYVRRYIHTRII